ncbi:hypothetical protein [Aquiflexum lacus]|uniref:hypothetical protein n=1 Tax=Aquiflexum lacus TaxID=2483805 RepID=UPI0018956502|nr:hypothetical protein [Aquiflexum lacus]
MEKFKELTMNESLEISGGISIKKIWEAIKYLYTALEIQDSVNEFVDGWNSVDCECKK